MTDGQQKTLYSERYEHDACGIGAIVSIDGTASYSIVNDALSIVEKLEHRAGKDAAGETGRRSRNTAADFTRLLLKSCRTSRIYTSCGTGFRSRNVFLPAEHSRKTSG